MPSISAKGSPSSSMRSAKVPESPSSALQTTYFRSATVSATVFHLMPVGKPAPPRPRRPDFATSCRVAAAPRLRARSRPRPPPWARQSARDSGSTMPQRAKVSRVWRFRKGMSSGRPRYRGWLAPAVSSPGASPGFAGPKAMRPSGVSTSTIGSSQNRPREPVRTIWISMPRRRASSCNAAATLSAPTARAAASRGTKKRIIIATPRSRSRRSSRRPDAPWARRRASPRVRRRTGRGNRPARP